MTTLKTLLNDENGFIVSAELIIVATIVVLSMAVGLSEISFSVNNELEDVGSATLMIDILSMHHETQYTRIFRS